MATRKRRQLALLVSVMVGLVTLFVAPASANAGYGGQTLYSTRQTSGSVAVIRTCYDPDGFGCTSNVLTWYTRANSSCTHFYPNNDYYKNSVPSFNRVYHLASLNCNVMVVYLNATQGGGGAVKFSVLAGNNAWLYPRLYQSISLHY